MYNITPLQRLPTMQLHSRRNLTMYLGMAQIFCLLVLINMTLAQEKSKSNQCVAMKKCGDCLGAGPPCGWCSQESYNVALHPDRCDLVEKLITNGCDYSHIVNPTSTIQYNKNEGPRNGDKTREAVQLSPQEVTIKVRPNEPFKFSVSFRQAENYPVDLYYVMDLSNSMADDKAKLAQLGNVIASEMNKITQNFRLGFGSFVDKSTMPYVSTVPEKLISPCEGCAAPYGFHNQLPLAEDTSQFATEVLHAKISGNLDSPEGGFDAIMQAISCQNEVGWRNQSRKMLLFSTDAGFHYAGDGKLGGIVTPNDGACHLNNRGFYSESLNQDYPSISQLSHRVMQQKVNVIFAVTENQLPIYEKLSQFIEGSTVGKLADDSSNIVELVKDNYKKISGSIELKTVPETFEDLSVTFKTTCLGSTVIEGSGNIMCNGLGISQNVTFEMSIEARSCPSDRSQWKKSFQVYPVGLAEKLTVNLELDCECNCEKANLEEPNSPKCSHSGTYECGSCTCNDGHYGATCQCDGLTVSNTDYEAACKMPNSTKGLCEGKGQCVCGKCDCLIRSSVFPSHRFSGTYCECDNYSCDSEETSPGVREYCGGDSRGTCACGLCNCRPDWGPGGTGSCKCSTKQDKCIAKANGKLCNGYGTCICNQCECDTQSNYKGPTCEVCPLCAGECDMKKPCVQCQAYKTGPYTKEDCAANCSHVVVRKELGQNEDQKNWHTCEFRDDDQCDAKFEYHYLENKVIAQETKECPKPVNTLAIILGVIGGIILIGLALLLIWKLLVTIHDRREFARFEKDREKARWDTGENPIYVKATTTYKNPMYANKS